MKKERDFVCTHCLVRMGSRTRTRRKAHWVDTKSSKYMGVLIVQAQIGQLPMATTSPTVSFSLMKPLPLMPGIGHVANV